MSIISLEKIESLAPDQASLDAAKKLLKPGSWPTLATDGRDLVWGECQGSGSTPYRVVVCEADAGYKCSCPSRKFPCKHSLALMWLRAENKQNFQLLETPSWVQDWLSRRRGPNASAQAASAKPKASIAAIAESDAPSADPKAEAKAAAARERNQKERETSILAGLEELDTWLSDQIAHGMLQFVSDMADSCRTMAQRLVDAKASGLATRLDGLPARLYEFPDQQRPVAAIKELAQFHLLAEAYRRQDDLGEALKSDVRLVIGWNIGREQLLTDSSALRASASWRIVASDRVTQPDRLIRQETWLLRQTGDDRAPRFALFLDFTPVAAAGSRSPYLVGEILDAELVFYPGILPLRALISQQREPTAFSNAPLILPADDLSAALSDWENRLAARPWLEAWPLVFNRARLVFVADQPYLATIPESGPPLSLPCDPKQPNLFGLSQLDAFNGIGLWDGNQFQLWWAETALGAWTAS
jgi:hypothetical protein